MKPMLGWTMLSRKEMRQVERSLINSEQDTRDEIGFLLIHQGFADRFFPGTSVLHTRVRYALLVPWLYQRAALNRRRGSDLDSTIRQLLIELAIRLKEFGGEPQDVIGGDKLGQLTSQPPDRVYWSAMRAWGLLLREVDSRSELLRRLERGVTFSSLDDDGARLNDDSTEVFASLPPPPVGWENPQNALNFKMPRREQDFLRGKLGLLTRPGENASALLANLAKAEVSFTEKSAGLPPELDARADEADKLALGVARDAAALAAIGRAVYGALVEEMIARDGGNDNRTYRILLPSHFSQYGEATVHCNLDAAEQLLPDLPLHVKNVLRQTQAYVRADIPENVACLYQCYEEAERIRKKSRARLLDTERAKMRRAEWNPERHNTTALHFRWKVVREMLNDLSEQP